MENTEKNFALEMREIADTCNAEREQEREKDHQVYIENYIKPTIRNQSRVGSYRAVFPYIRCYSGTLLAKMLEAEGFTVTVRKENQMLYIEW